jgi:hypothetical protein
MVLGISMRPSMHGVRVLFVAVVVATSQLVASKPVAQNGINRVRRISGPAFGPSRY